MARVGGIIGLGSGRHECVHDNDFEVIDLIEPPIQIFYIPITGNATASV